MKVLRNIAIVSAAACALSLSAIVAGPALAATSSGPVTGTVTLTPVVLRSLTVSTNSLNLNACYTNAAAFTSALAGGGDATSSTLAPGGFCTPSGPQFTITNGPVAGHIDVQGSNATAATGTGSWTLTTVAPTVDTFNLSTITFAGNGTTAGFSAITPTSSIDNEYCQTANTTNCGGVATAGGTSAGEYLGLSGPTSSTGTGTAYDFTVTWTAVP